MMKIIELCMYFVDISVLYATKYYNTFVFLPHDLGIPLLVGSCHTNLTDLIKGPNFLCINWEAFETNVWEICLPFGFLAKITLKIIKQKVDPATVTNNLN